VRYITVRPTRVVQLAVRYITVKPWSFKKPLTLSWKCYVLNHHKHNNVILLVQFNKFNNFNCISSNSVTATEKTVKLRSQVANKYKVHLVMHFPVCLKVTLSLRWYKFKPKYAAIFSCYLNPDKHKTQNSVRPFIYFPTTCFGRSIRQSSGRKYKYINRKVCYGRGLFYSLVIYMCFCLMAEWSDRPML